MAGTATAVHGLHVTNSRACTLRRVGRPFHPTRAQNSTIAHPDFSELLKSFNFVKHVLSGLALDNRIFDQPADCDSVTDLPMHFT